MQITPLLLSITLLLASPANAATQLTRGQVAPADGWFFTVEEERVVRYRLMEADYMEKRLALEDDLIKQLNTKLDLESKLTETYRTAFYNENERLTKLLQQNLHVKWGMYLLGVVTTIGGGLALGMAGKALK